MAAPITVQSISPNTGPSAGGTTVVITGTNLEAVAAVYFGQTAASNFTINSNTQLTAVSPAGSGAVSIKFYVGGASFGTFTYT